MLDRSHRPIPGLYAAGELVGGLFFHNYPGGTGLMAGVVSGAAPATPPPRRPDERRASYDPRNRVRCPAAEHRRPP